jgi:hypothetical protein
VKLSPPQRELLEDLIVNPEMYITRYSKWDRTAQALVRRKLATVAGAGTGYPQYMLRVTDEGRAEALAQGIAGGAR